MEVDDHGSDGGVKNEAGREPVAQAAGPTGSATAVTASAAVTPAHNLSSSERMTANDAAIGQISTGTVNGTSGAVDEQQQSPPGATGGMPDGGEVDKDGDAVMGEKMAADKTNHTQSDTSQAAADEQGDDDVSMGVGEQRAEQRPMRNVEDFYQALTHHFQLDESAAEEEAGRTLAAKLFTVVYDGMKARGAKAKKPTQLPNTTDQQQDQLLQLLRAMIKDKRSSLQRVSSAITDLVIACFRSTWTLDQLLKDRVAKAQVPTAPPSVAWGRSVESKPTSVEKGKLTADMAAFRFDTTVFKAEDIQRLRAVCQATHGFAEQTRKPTEDEWTIIWGIMNGSILMRILPQFLKRCCTMKQFQWLHHYMVVAVEGELYATLPAHVKVYDVNQTSKRLADSVRASIIHQSWTDTRVSEMLQAVKVVSYNKERHALHFHFYTKKEAIQWENMLIPYRNLKVELKNPDARYREVTIKDDGTTAISFKPPTDGARDDRYQAPYKFRLTNITRTTEIDKIAQFLQQITNNALRIGVPVDSYGQGSEWSLVWEFFGVKSNCPPALVNINRILWRDHPILVQHCTGAANAPCHKCARIGHQESACPTPETEWLTECTIVVTEPEIAALATERAIWQSPEDARAIFERLGAVTDVGKAIGGEKASPPTSEDTSAEKPAATSAPPKLPHLQTPLEQATSEWRTVMNKRNRTHPTASPTDKPTASKGAGTEATSTGRLGKTGRTGGKPRNKKQQRREPEHQVISVDSEEDTDSGHVADDAQGTESDSDEEQKRGMTEKEAVDVGDDSDDEDDNMRGGAAEPAQGPSEKRTASKNTPSRRAQDVLDNAVALSNMERLGMAITAMAKENKKELDAAALAAALQVKLPDLGKEASKAWLLEALSAQIAATPATGNCQPYAIIEALLQRSLKGMENEEAAIEMTMLLKFGMQLAHGVDHEHELRTSSIAAIGEDRASDPEAIEKYFADLAVSSSDRASTLPLNLWGGNDTLRMAAKLLGRRIDLIIETADSTHPYVVQIQPQRVSDRTTRELVDSAVEGRPGTQLWLEKIRDDLSKGTIPIILHYSSSASHYNAVLLHRDPLPVVEKRQTDLRSLLNPVQSIDQMLQHVKDTKPKQRAQTIMDDDEGPTRQQLLDSQSDISASSGLSVLKQKNWSRGEKKIVIECLVRDPTALREMLTFYGSQESEASIQCAQNSASSAPTPSSDSSYRPSSDAETDDSDAGGDEAPYAFPEPEPGRQPHTWVKQKWKEVRADWDEQDGAKLPEIDNQPALHSYAARYPEEMILAGHIFANPFLFLNYFEADGLQAWMAHRWLLSGMKSIGARLETIGDEQVQAEVREWLNQLTNSNTTAVRLRKWQSKKIWTKLRGALPQCFRGPTAVPFLAETMSMEAVCVHAIDALVPTLAQDLQNATEDTDMEPKSLAQLYMTMPAFKSALDATVTGRDWEPIENYLKSLKWKSAGTKPAARC